MTKTECSATAGLVFTTVRDLDIVRLANHVMNSVGGLGLRVTGTHILSDTSAMVTVCGHEIHLEITDDVALPTLPAPAASYLSVSIAGTGPRAASTFARDSIIARVLQTLHRDLRPAYVKWIDTEVLLASADFAHAIGPGPGAPESAETPFRASAVTRISLPDIEETNAILQRRLTDCDPVIFDLASSPDRVRDFFSNPRDPWSETMATDADGPPQDLQDIEHAAPRRLSAWLMSFAVALFALPVGVALMVLNLLKGENLRLASQTAALTGTFIALQAYGSTAHALGLLRAFLG